MEIKKCACGNDPVLTGDVNEETGDYEFQVVCKACGRHTAHKFAPRKAIRIWNKKLPREE